MEAAAGVSEAEGNSAAGLGLLGLLILKGVFFLDATALQWAQEGEAITMYFCHGSK